MKETKRREREAQSLKLRRAVLKASNNQLSSALLSSCSDHDVAAGTAGGSITFGGNSSSRVSHSASAASLPMHLPAGIHQQLADSRDAYSDRLAALNSFKKKSKASTRQHALKIEHVQEHAALQQQGHSTERDLSSLLEVMAESYPGCEAIQGIIADFFALSAARGDSSREVVGQMGDIRALLREAVRSQNAHTQARGTSAQPLSTSNPNPDPNPNRGTSAQLHAPILGGMLVQIHGHFHAYLDELCREEGLLTLDVAAAHSAVASTLQHERLSAQTANFHSAMRPTDGDDAFVLVALEEWRGKLDRLDASHDGEVQAIKAERQRCDVLATATATATMTGACGDAVAALSGDGDANDNDEAVEAAEAAADPRGAHGVDSIRAGDGADWPKTNHDLFAKAYSHSAKTGLRRAQLLSQLCALLPGYSLQQIESHEVWYRSCRALQLRKAAAVQEYESTRSGLIAEACAALEALRLQVWP